MKSIIFASACMVFISCSKDPGNITKDPNNHLEAVVTFTSGSMVTISETGQTVTMGIGGYGDYYANAINSQNQEVGISTSTSSGNAGYYDPTGPSGPNVYRSFFQTPGDTIIYSVVSGSHREGNFHFTCIKTPGDTARITGSFKGKFGN